MKRFFLFALIVVSLISVFTSCEKDEPVIPVQDIVIKFSGGDNSNQNGGLKSAIIVEEVTPDGDVKIFNQKGRNFVLSAETRDGLAVQGEWEIYLNRNDLEGEDFFLAANNQGQSSGSIASFRADNLGKYFVTFRPEGSAEFISFSITHEGLPGSVGDSHVNNYSFRMEKQNFFRNGQGESAFTVYIKYNKNEFSSWGTQNGVDPKDENNFQALLRSGSGNTFEVGDQTYCGKNFKLKKCEFSPGYLSFTFFPSDEPPMNGDISYSIVFYSGVYGQDYWLFKSQQESSWRDKNFNGITFKMF